MAFNQLPEQGVFMSLHVSNLFIEGQKTAANKKGLVHGQDFTYRLKIDNVVESVFNGRQKAMCHCYIVRQEKDRVLKHFQQLSSVTLGRKSWSGKEKEVDMALMLDVKRDCDMVRKLHANQDLLRFQGMEDGFDVFPSRVYAILSGSIGFAPLVAELLQHGFRVEIYSWACGLSQYYRTECNEFLRTGQLKVVFLDESWLEIGFCESVFNANKDVMEDPKYIVLVFAKLSENRERIVEALTALGEAAEGVSWEPHTSDHEDALYMIMLRQLNMSDLEDDVFEASRRVAGDLVFSLMEWKRQRCSLTASPTRSSKSGSSLGTEVSVPEAHPAPRPYRCRDRGSLDNTHVEGKRCIYREFCHFSGCDRSSREHTEAELELFSLNRRMSPFRPDKGYVINVKCTKHDLAPRPNQPCKNLHSDQAKLCFSCCKFFGNSLEDDLHRRSCDVTRPLMRTGPQTNIYLQQRTGRCPLKNERERHVETYCPCIFCV